MIYAVSDLHGCYEPYQKLLDRLCLRADDTLYVLGDVIDRGPDGFQILLDMASRPNVVQNRSSSCRLIVYPSSGARQSGSKRRSIPWVFSSTMAVT